MKLNPKIISGIVFAIVVSVIVGLLIWHFNKPEPAPTHKKLKLLVAGATGNDVFKLSVDGTDLLVDEQLIVAPGKLYEFDIPLDSKSVSFDFRDNNDDILVSTLTVDGTSILSNFDKGDQWSDNVYDHASNGELKWPGTYKFTI